MITVRTKEELEQALKNNQDLPIRVEGAYAKTFANQIRSESSKKKVGKAAMLVGGLAVLGGVIAAPFTGGASLAGSAAGAAALGLTIGTVTITAGELAMILGFGAFAITQKYKIKIGSGDRYVELEPK